MGLGNDFLCFAYVIVTSRNNKIRVTLNGSALTVTLTPGIYPVGYGGANPAGAADSASFGVSLLEQLATDVSAAFSAVANFGLQSKRNAATGIAASPTGYVWAKFPAGSHVLNFAHADTSMPREWFGVGPEINTVSWSGTSWTNVSNFSSALAMVGDRAIMKERPIERTADMELQADTGTVYRATLAATKRSRDLRFQVDGLPAADRDNRYNHLRRFYASLRSGGCSKRFVYIPDEANFGSAWDPDGSSTAIRSGYVILNALGPLEWDVEPKSEPFQGLYEPRVIPCMKYVAPS